MCCAWRVSVASQRVFGGPWYGVSDCWHSMGAYSDLLLVQSVAVSCSLLSLRLQRPLLG